MLLFYTTRLRSDCLVKNVIVKNYTQFPGQGLNTIISFYVFLTLLFIKFTEFMC